MKVNWLEEVKRRKEELLHTTREFLKIPSILDEQNGKPGAPFGEEVARALDFVLQQCESMGMKTKNLDGYIGYGEMGEGDEMIGVLCHVDVVPPGDGWSVPPFSGTVTEERIISRGAIDDKGPTMAALFAAKIIHEMGLPLNRRVRLIFGADEESEWRCIERYKKTEEMPAFGFAPDADFPLIYAEKGMYNIGVKINIDSEHYGSIQLLRFHSGLRSNMVPDMATVTLRFLNEEEKTQVKKTFHQFLQDRNCNGNWYEQGLEAELAIEGRSAHGSTPQKGVHAGWLMAKFLQTIQLDPAGAFFIQCLQDCFVDDPFGEKLFIQTEHEDMGPLTVNVGVIQYSTENNEEFHLSVNIRYPKNTNPDHLRERITERLARYHATIIFEDKSLTPHYVPKDHPLIKTLQRIYHEHTGEETEPIAIGGATYARSLPVGVAFGPLFPGREDTAHQKDEYILIEDLLTATAIYAQAIYELANM